MPGCCSGGMPTEIETGRETSCRELKRPTTSLACGATPLKQRHSHGPARPRSLARPRHALSEPNFVRPAPEGSPDRFGFRLRAASERLRPDALEAYFGRAAGVIPCRRLTIVMRDEQQ